MCRICLQEEAGYLYRYKEDKHYVTKKLYVGYNDFLTDKLRHIKYNMGELVAVKITPTMKGKRV